MGRVTASILSTVARNCSPGHFHDGTLRIIAGIWRWLRHQKFVGKERYMSHTSITQAIVKRSVLHLDPPQVALLLHCEPKLVFLLGISVAGGEQIAIGIAFVGDLASGFGRGIGVGNRRL
ncbi:hypothetical protein PMIN04_000565 [Paraphaeosphaeria minitans]